MPDTTREKAVIHRSSGHGESGWGGVACGLSIQRRVAGDVLGTYHEWNARENNLPSAVTDRPSLIYTAEFFRGTLAPVNDKKPPIDVGGLLLPSPPKDRLKHCLPSEALDCIEKT